MNLESFLAQFRAEVEDLNASATLDLHAFRSFNCEPRNLWVVFSMLDAVMLKGAVGWRRYKPTKGAAHGRVCGLQFGESDGLTTNFNYEGHTR